MALFWINARIVFNPKLNYHYSINNQNTAQNLKLFLDPLSNIVLYIRFITAISCFIKEPLILNVNKILSLTFTIIS